MCRGRERERPFTDLPDGWVMNLGGGAEKMQQEADKLGISVNELAQSPRSLVASQAGATSSLANRGLRNHNKATSGNSDAVRLGEEIDRYVTGQSDCDVVTSWGNRNAMYTLSHPPKQWLV